MAPKFPNPEGDGDSSDSDADLYETSIDGPTRDFKTESELEPKVKRIIKEWVQSKGDYETKEDADGVASDRDSSADDRYAFTVVRWLKRGEDEATTTIEIRSRHLIRMAKEVMDNASTIGWASIPVKFLPEELLVFHPQFQSKLNDLEQTRGVKFGDETFALRNHLRFFVRWLELEFSATLRELRQLLKGDQVTFHLIWGVCPLGSVLYSRHHATGDPCALRLLSTSKRKRDNLLSEYWSLRCEYIDFHGPIPGYAERIIEIDEFKGVTNAVDLPAYPIRLNPDYEEICASLITRGRERYRLAQGIHVMHYDSIAFRGDSDSHGKVDYKKVPVNSRIVVDRESFSLHAPYYPPFVLRTLDRVPLDDRVAPVQKRILSDSPIYDETTLSDDLALLVTPDVFGFSLAHRTWFEFSMTYVKPVTWDAEAFRHLVLPPHTKELVKSLIHNHVHGASTFGDFIAGKGNGLIFNLFGPPGVGKTLTAEATGEYTKMPVYIVSAGDLGITAEKVDAQLSHVFALATAWQAIVLIDEADVFLEQRSLSALERNAMVAVFLRQIEYFHGILILTTNRVQAFDAAMQSRIDISLHYPALTVKTKETLWLAFLKRAGVTELDDAMKAAVKEFRTKNFNGRQIKNFVKAANAMAALEEDRTLRAQHLHYVVGISEDFMAVEEGRHTMFAKMGYTLPLVALCGLSALAVGLTFLHRAKRL